MRYEDGGECEAPGESWSGGNKFFTTEDEEIVHGLVFYYPGNNLCKVLEVEI